MTERKQKGYNSVRGDVRDVDNKVIDKYAYMCYGRCMQYEYVDIRNSKAKWYTFYFPDTLSKLLSSTEQTDKFIEIMNSLGLFRKASYTFLEKDLSIAKWESNAHYDRMFSYTVDIDEVTGQELFFIGQVVRCMNTHPYIISDFLELLKLEPDIAPFTLFQMAHCCTVLFDTIREDNGSTLIPNHASILFNTSIADIQKHIDETKGYQVIRKGTNYGFSGYLEYKFYKNINYKIKDYRSTVQGRPQQGKEKYSKELTATFFDETAFMNMFNYQPVKGSV